MAQLKYIIHEIKMQPTQCTTCKILRQTNIKIKFVGCRGSVVGLGPFRPEGRRFESHSSRHIGTFEKSFTRSCLERFGMLTPTLYQCCSRECFRKAHAVRSTI